MSGTAGAGERIGRALHVLAFASGAAALAYEVSWTKWLSLTFGSSTLAASATVAAFMGGMGIGAFGYHRIQARVASPLRLYAGLEFGIAASAIGLGWLLERLPSVFVGLLSLLPEAASAGGVWIRVGGALAVLLVPTALMGATYPALCSVAISSRSALDRHLGALYGWNTIGAAAGGLIAGIVVIPALGLDAAVALGVAINLAVGLAALALDRRTSAAASELVDEPGIETSLPRAVTGAVLFLSGTATLAYEIVWFRAYRSIAGNSTYSFTIVLVTFLLGLGFGALGLRRVLARGDPERSLARVQLGVALAAAFGMASLAEVLASPLGDSLSMFSREVRLLTWPLRLALHGGLALLLMLPATLLMGLSFPLASRLYVGGASEVGKRVGGAVLLANLGSIVGSIGAATVLLPLLGSMQSTRLLVALNVVLALAVAHFVPGSRVQRLRWLVPGVVAIALVSWLIPAVIPYRGSALPGHAARVIFQEEGEIATVRVSEAVDQPAFLAMSIDGTTIGVTGGWDYPVYSKQILLAQLPMWLEPRIRSVLQIGLGSASTLHALTLHPALERIEAVEISSSVIRGARLFPEAVALDDPRVTVHVEDALHHLLRAREPYDLIVSDGKQNADFSGNAKMTSLELYRLSAQRLSEYGLFVQWIDLANLHDDLRTIVRTAGAVFPYFDVFYEPPRAALFVGALRPLEGRPHMRARDVPRAVTRGLRVLGIADLAWLRLGWMADRDALLQVAGPGPLNTWEYPVVEFSAYRERMAGGYQTARNLDWLLEAYRLARGRAPRGFLLADDDARRAHELLWRAYAVLLRDDTAGAIALLEQARLLAPRDPLVARALQRIQPR